MREAILSIPEQFSWQPEIQNPAQVNFKKLILCGMGGSRLAGGFLKMLRPDLDIQIHNDYGLPEQKENAFVAVCSYSGNTEEEIGNFHAAKDEGLPFAIVTSGGKLLELGKEAGVPLIQLPTGLLPRLASILSLKALLALIGDKQNLEALSAVWADISMPILENKGKAVAENINSTPLIYSSRKNACLAEYWKISFNETSKAPSFWNVFPEAGHNELAGIPKENSFDYIFLLGSGDHPRISLKMSAFQEILKTHGFVPQEINLSGNILKKIAESFTLASWAGFYLAEKRGVDPDDQKAIEDFKKSLN